MMSRHKRKLERQEGAVENGRSSKRAKTKQSQVNATQGDITILKESLEHAVDGTTAETVTTISEEKKKPSKRADSSTWTVSEAIGGSLQDLDPIFSTDEQFLLLAYGTSVGIYHTESADLQSRTLRTTRLGHITGFAIASDDSRLYISLSTGLIELWKWTKEKRLSKWDTKSQIYSLKTARHAISDSKCDIVYTVDCESPRDWRITAHRLRIGDKAQLHTLYKSQDPITQLKVLDDGRVVVASAGQRLIIGTTHEPDLLNLKDVSYTWREIESSEWISGLDVKVSIDNRLKAKANNSQPQEVPSINVVVGGLKGSLFSYQDVLGNLWRKESNQTSMAPFSQRLHWHRNGVSAVKWSLDGNYIISGGMETVLVLWQLDTGKKQFLPHLSAAIESIVVSPSGLCYAIRLANNSVKIISTTELQPTFSMSGVQISHQNQVFAMSAPHVPIVGLSHRRTRAERIRVPATMSPSSGQLLLAAPAASSPSSRTGVPQDLNAAFLQTVDIKSGRQISNQALTRTKVTSLNMGPEANIIEGPNVILLQISHDSQWLATVDEWSPPILDIDPLVIDAKATFKEHRLRMEVFLKFWAWNSDKNTWELTSRVDGPHTGQSCGSRIGGKVLDLNADPSSVGFATVGEDRIIKLWRAKKRKRNGVEVRNKDKKLLFDWSCRFSITLPININPLYLQSFTPPHAKLAISEDGSLLAVGHQLSTDALVHMIDTDNGNTVSTLTDLISGHLQGLGIIHRYLVLLSNELVVWDLVDNEICWSFSLGSDAPESKRIHEPAHLAIDQRNQTFAVSVPKSSKKALSRLTIFDPSSPNYLSTHELPRNLKVLLSLTQRKAYLAIDTRAEIRIITPRSQTVQALKFSVPSQEISTAGLENLFINGQTTKVDPVFKDDRSLSDSDDIAVVRQHQLTEIFDRPSSELPSMTILFQEVAKLFSKKDKQIK